MYMYVVCEWSFQLDLVSDPHSSVEHLFVCGSGMIYLSFQVRARRGKVKIKRKIKGKKNTMLNGVHIEMVKKKQKRNELWELITPDTG